MADYSKIPANATLQIHPFTAHVSDQKLADFHTLLRLSPIGTAAFENTHAGRTFGTQRSWLSAAKQQWQESFDWRQHEAHINSFPNFTATVTNKNLTLDIHFIALFSENPDAIPLAFFHGWPGSFLEFLDILALLKNRYTPQTLPYHIIVPSLPGYAYSAGPPIDVDFSVADASGLLDKLLVGLGFGTSGYLVQGGDIGSTVARELASKYESCKGMHLNMISMGPPENVEGLEVNEGERKVMASGERFFDSGCAYALEHGQRTATIGLALSASPVAMLSWIGEKFLEWTDEDPPVEKILQSVTLYWMTETFPRCLYPYRGNGAGDSKPRQAQLSNFGKFGRGPTYVSKPSGYSLFPYDLMPVPGSWAATTMNLVSYSQHNRGGHFAAMEKPEELLADVEEWVRKAWKGSNVKL